MARSLKLRHASWVFGFGGALVLGASFLFRRRNDRIGQKGCAGRRIVKEQTVGNSKSKAWKSAGDSESKAAAKHHPRPFVDLKNSAAVAAAVDKMILENLNETGTTPAQRLRMKISFAACISTWRGPYRCRGR